MQVVDHAKDKFHSGRLAGNFGPPVCLFNRHLGLFDYHMSHLDDESFPIDLAPTLIRTAHRFRLLLRRPMMSSPCGRTPLKFFFSEIFPIPLDWETSTTRFNIRPSAINLGKKTFFVVEVKNEAALEGDASLQAALSYAHIATTRVPSLSFSLF